MRLALVVPLVLLLAGCSSSPPSPATTSTTPTVTTPTTTPTTGMTVPPPTAPAPAAPTAFGVSISPKSYQGADLTDFFAEAKQVGTLVLWGGSVDELANASSAPYALATLAKSRGLSFMAQVGFARAPNESTRADVVRYATSVKPAFLALGVELDREQERDPALVDAIAAWWGDTHDAVHAASPDTLVFPTFQYERIGGHTGGLYGGPASSPARWSVIERFPARDLTAFTTYPLLVAHDPEDLNASYYDDAVAHAGGKPLAFTETGHFAGDSIPSYESSADEQARYVAWLAARVDALHPKLVVWLHLHDQPQIHLAPFQTMGLIDASGAKRPAYETWRALATGASP